MSDKICQEIQMQLLLAQESRAPLPEEAAAHLKACAECREFQETLEAVSAPAPTPELDKSTLRLCHQELRAARMETSRKTLLAHRWMRWVCSTAAAVALIAGILFVNTRRNAPRAPTKGVTVTPGETIADAKTTWDDDVLLDTELSLINSDLSAMNLELGMLVVDLY